MKMLSDGYQPKKSKILDADGINRFIAEVDNTFYALEKQISNVICQKSYWKVCNCATRWRIIL